MIPERLERLRQEMEKRGIDVYIVPTADFHQSEYVGEHFKARAFITGFTGSAGTAIITKTEAGLWTDGRYFVQAGLQLRGTTVTLYKMGEEGVPTVEEHLRNTLKEGGCLGFDGRVVSTKEGREFAAIVSEKSGSLYTREDLVDLIWSSRPPLSREPMTVLDEKYAGKSIGDKLAALRRAMKDKGAQEHLISSLYDIAWLLNIRGGDIRHVPVVLSYLSLTQDRCLWFLQKEIVTEKIQAYLDENGVEIRSYDEFYDYVRTIPQGTAVLLDPSVINYRICTSLPENTKLIEAQDPSVLMRSVKNETEVENTRKAHVKDAVAMCKFMYWLKNNIGKIPMTEISVSDYLEGLRREQEGFLDLSFDTISAYAEHGAICHYSAAPESNKELHPEGFLLVDSGGHYLEGTTDITRTFALGELTEEMRANFTRVCRANMNLANARFLYGCTGRNLDYIAREPLWEAGLDYKHGTGHGVGYVLNVHEGPQSFRWKLVPGTPEQCLEEGMITTDEPGIYLEGRYGIRTENELVCRKGEKNEYGQFMYFENITYVPIDLDAIDPEQITGTEKRRLNEYHARVYETIAPYLTEEEALWLKKYTRAI
ncbi:MAG: aminopeptidase P family protein [Eubacteriales bacterium]|nr:aminopeptidase P family protein [Eubacteriales bacterium]